MNMYNTGIIIQARINSTRLPAKIIRKVDGDLNFLQILLFRLKEGISLRGKTIPIVLATSKNIDDAVLEKIGKDNSIPVFRGSEENVLERFIGAAQAHNLDTVVRICSDNPFIDIDLLFELLTAYKGEDYLSFKVNEKPSILTHFGFFVEIVSLKGLTTLQKENCSECLEHVTNCIYTNPHKFKVNYLPLDIPEDYVRCTLDTSADFEILKEIYFEWFKKLKPEEPVNYREIIAFLEQRPSMIAQMRQQIKQNSK